MHTVFLSFLVPAWMLVSQNTILKDMTALKCPFHQLCLKALDKGLLTTFSEEQSDGYVVKAWARRHYFEKMNWFPYQKKLYFLVPFESIWSPVSLLFGLVWLYTLPFYEKKSAFLRKGERDAFCFLWYYLLLLQSAANGWLILFDKVPYVFQFTVLCWGKGIISPSHWAVNITVNMTLHSQPFRVVLATWKKIVCLVIEQLFSLFYSPGFMANSLEQIFRKSHPNWMADTCNQLQWASTGGNSWIAFIDVSNWVN